MVLRKLMQGRKLCAARAVLPLLQIWPLFFFKCLHWFHFASDHPCRVICSVGRLTPGDPTFTNVQK